MVIDVVLEVIDDNPYNPRKHYPQAKIKEMAQSLLENGLRQVPEGREVGGRVQLAYGHMRLRGFAYNQKHERCVGWGTMPVDVKTLSNQEMFSFAIEENIRRTDITPLELARCIEAFNLAFPDVLDEDIARKHCMTAANVSNMKRVLRLPEKFLEKIDEGIITFTQGRELLTLEGLPNAEDLMSSALAGINTTGNKRYSEPNTVEGLQHSIHSAIKDKFPPIDKEWEGYYRKLLFNTREAGCLKCDKCIITHPTKSQAAHYCTDEVCWEKKTEDHKAKAAAAAKAKMEAEVLKRAAVNISQEKSEPAVPKFTLEKRGTSWIALDGQGRIIAIDYDKKAAEDKAKASFNAVPTKVNPTSEEYLLNHTYRIIHIKVENIPDVTAQDLTTAIKAVGVRPENVESVKVWKSSGNIGTGGSVSAGWSKCTEPLEALAPLAEVERLEPELAEAEKILEDRADEMDQRLEEARERANLERPVGELPCETCGNEPTCGREGFRVSGDGDDRYICDEWIPREPAEITEAVEEPPADVMEQARAAAGTRAEVLDLNDIRTGYNEMKTGYALLSYEVKHIDDPKECLERCTHGFHYAFDSKYPGEKEIFVCSDPKCLSQKKGDHTRKVNAEGQARKNAERKAIQEAIQGAGNRPRGLMLLVIYAQIKGSHVSNYYYGGSKAPEKWLWDKLSAGTKEGDRNINAMMKRLDKLDEDELRQLLVGMMFYYLADHGDTGSYEIKTALPLKWLGVDIQMEEKEEVGNAR